MGVSFVEARRTCCAFSPGGHRAELERALAGIRFLDRFDVTYRTDHLVNPLRNRTLFVTHPRRSVLRTLAAAIESVIILIRERPRLVISTGADVAVPIFVIGKLTGCRTVFIETGGSATATLAGRLAYPFSDLFIVQWRERLKQFPKAQVASGPLF